MYSGAEARGNCETDPAQNLSHKIATRKINKRKNANKKATYKKENNRENEEALKMQTIIRSGVIYFTCYTSIRVHSQPNKQNGVIGKVPMEIDSILIVYHNINGIFHWTGCHRSLLARFPRSLLFFEYQTMDLSLFRMQCQIK